MLQKKDRYEVKALENYGNVKKGEEYLVLDEGYDYLVIRCRGKNLCIPRCLVY